MFFSRLISQEWLQTQIFSFSSTFLFFSFLPFLSFILLCLFFPLIYFRFIHQFIRLHFSSNIFLSTWFLPSIFHLSPFQPSTPTFPHLSILPSFRHSSIPLICILDLSIHLSFHLFLSTSVHFPIRDSNPIHLSTLPSLLF